MRKAKHEVEDKGLWQMSKFKKVGPHLKTFRSDVDRDAAFEVSLQYINYIFLIYLFYASGTHARS